LGAFRQADLIISSSCIEYLDSIPEVLACFRALLREGGVLIFSVSNHDSLSRKLVRFVHRLTGRPRYLGLLRHFMTAEEIHADLVASGLVYLEHAYFAGADRLNRTLSHFLAPQFTSNMIIVAARRA
jgi:SAM-dependent methyltransferase